MRCRKPASGRGGLFPCGQCLPCRLNRRRVWTHRCILEAAHWPENAFITLTYDDNHVPITRNKLLTLEPSHLRNWFKRYRKAIEPTHIRYFAVGEYGDRSERPHYHALIFNFGTCFRGRTIRRAGSTRPNWRACCDRCRLVGNTWGKGDVDLGTVEDFSAQYVAGYVVKKLTAKDNPLLKGRYPEFQRTSKMDGGLGINAVGAIAATLSRFNLETTQTDVPVSLRHGKKVLPVGRYLRQKVRLALGKDIKAPQAALDEYQAQMLDVRLAARADKENPSVKYHLIQKHRGAVDRLENRSKIHKKRGDL